MSSYSTASITSVPLSYNVSTEIAEKLCTYANGRKWSIHDSIANINGVEILWAMISNLP